MSKQEVSNTIDDLSTLENHFGEPLDVAVAVMKTSMDKYHRQFIEHSPFACLASSSSDGQPTISPKGDTPGFVKILDETTLVIPDRRGNNKVESFHNILENPKVALIFFIPGVLETLRIAGKARIVTDKEILELGRTGNNLPATAMVIDVSKVYFHCGKAMIRSKLWAEDSQMEKGVLPSFGEIVKAQAQLDADVEAVQANLDEAYEKNLN